MEITLKAARVNAGLTIEEVAKLSGRNKNTIVSWEKGVHQITKTDFDMLCELYKIDPQYVKQY